MAPKNIDETIKKLLQEYANWCYSVLQKEHKRITKQYFPTKEDRVKAVQEYTVAKKAYEYLLEIAKDPKKYLYTNKDIIYSDVVDYNKLDPVLNIPFDRSGKNLLVRLSEQIARHVAYTENKDNGVWVYYGNSVNRDLEAEAIIMMSKTVELWNDNSIKAALKDVFLPVSVFAVDLNKKVK